MTTAAYVRVSSASQTAEMQRDAIDRGARARGHTVTAWYADTFTGGGAHPPELVRLFADARAGLLERLYVYRLDRLSRRGIRDMLTLVEQLRHGGVQVVSLADGFDLDGPASEIILAVLAWAAKMERHAIGERIRAARERVEAAGGNWGRPSRVGPDLRARMLAMRASGRTVREIAAAVKVPRATVYRVLSRKGVPKGGIRKAVDRQG